MVDLCIYHANCMDGFTAAWAVKKRHPKVELVAASYDDTPPYVEGLDVAIVDFSYSCDVMTDMASVAESMIVLDHHASAYEAILKLNDNCDNVTVEFDLERSGAGLAWEYFHGRDSNMPMLISLVQDRDLWKFELTGSKQLHAYLTSQPYEMRVWDEAHNALEAVGINATQIPIGDGIMRMQTQQIKAFIKERMFYNFAFGHYVPFLNCPPLWTSEAGSLMNIQENVPFVVLFSIGATTVNFGLRSSVTGSDVQELAKRFDGGGHKHAAGFNMPRDNMRFHAVGTAEVSTLMVEI